MNVEVEIKLKVDSLEEVRRNLPSCGKLIKSINQIDEYFIPCQRDFFARKPEPVEWLRIRTNPDKVVFEYDTSVNKKAGEEHGWSEEYETEISNPEEFRKILGFLDFKKVITVDKNREYWDCGDMEVVLDDVKDLGSFVEVEAKRKFNDTKEALKKCTEFAKEIGIKNVEKSRITKGYPYLLLEKKQLI
jgi:adenylate cyclase class 2